MKLTVFGATGKTGLQIVEQALARGHEVNAFVRDGNKMTVKNPNLVFVQGDVLDPHAVERAVAGSSAVLVALGGKPDTKATVLSEGTGFVIDAMVKHGVQRLIVESSYPMSGSPEGMEFLQGTPQDMMAMMKPAIEDKMGQEKRVRESGLDYTIVRPLILTDGAQTGQYRAAETLEIKKTDTISRADVADFMLKALESNQWVGKTVVLSY